MSRKPRQPRQPYSEWQPKMRQLLREKGPLPLRAIAADLNLPYSRVANNIHAIARGGTIRLTSEGREITVHLEPWAEDEEAVVSEMRRRRGATLPPQLPPITEEEIARLTETHLSRLTRQAKEKLFAPADLYLTGNLNILAAWPDGPAARHAQFLGHFTPTTTDPDLRRAIQHTLKTRNK